MGQKTHPKGFRLVTNQKHLSEWYTGKKQYPTLIAQDDFIRKHALEYFEEFLSPALSSSSSLEPSSS